MSDPELAEDPFAHLKQRAAERADRTVKRLRAGIAALRAAEHKITAESLKRVTRELEPGFAGLSSRRNPRAYQLYREAASAFSASTTPDVQPRGKRRRTRRTPRSSYDPLQGLDTRDLVRRIRTLEQNVATERQQRGAMAYDQQTLLARIVRLETDIILLRAEGSNPE